MKIKLIGCDPSMRNFGYATGLYDIDTGELEIIDLNLVETKPADKATKKLIRQNCQDLDSAQEQFRGMIAHVTQDVAFCIAEVPVGSQSARAMMSCGLCIGVLSGCPVPIIPVTPTQVKKAGVGIGTATKDEMIAWATKRFPDAPWLTQKRKGAVEYLGKNEHLADACACLLAGIETPEFKAAVAMMKTMKASGV